MSCSCAKVTDEYHGWECDITGGACMFLYPSSKQCAEKYGEGPDAYQDNPILNAIDSIIDETLEEVINEKYDE